MTPVRSVAVLSSHQIDPQILVVTLEIIDMHEAFQKQKADLAKERAEK
jgi:hypothetical protein